ncbi:ShlB/FhaC/HecB family hemolysin secretion/activation protein [Microbulbifer halophilus]|uniref:ShlB/FhaC/HecB family hemolysin secretion/activation protein n=1 Tax=Microbulbifer halophilus TaxID=453963 RepID=A0ABW5ECN4_9GAMM|nr:ShlB/FhaC/HecB family hemolysin secretion/activation protein [Microbulbifer halophilus]MCW8126050.1 ShlB/FhaC/HecB family hemolysin secretion/activation protein [Microbulbifer halophilus]
MFSRYRSRLAVVGASLLLLPPAAQSQDEGSSFRSKVRAAFDQDVPTVSEQDASREFLQRRREARDPNLDTDIPEASQRTEGPRISVKEFRFHRLKEFPEYGVTREKVQRLAEELRVKFMKEDQLVASGYTVEELEELALQLDGIGARYNAEDLGPAELRRLVNMVEKQNAERGLTFGDLEEIAAEMTRFYRKQGLFLAQVLIPAQEVSDGVVTLTVQEGLLGQIVADDNKKYSLEQLSEPFEGQRGQLVSHDSVEEGLYLLNDLPSLNITGYFSAGENPGETKLNLRVRDESSWRMVSRFDNHGSTFTGDQRMFNSVDWLNPLGIGDALTLGYLKSSDASNLDEDFGSDLGQFRYSLPMFGARTRLQLSADYNQFKLHDVENPNNVVNLLEIEGVNESYAVSIDHKFRRSRDFNLTGSFSLTEKKSELEAIVPLPEPGDHVYGGELGLYVDTLSSGAVSMLNILNAKVQYGEHQNPVEEERGVDFTKFAADSNSLILVPMPFSDKKSRLILKSRWQYSDSSLPAFEQFPLGGANGVRSFNVRDFSADTAGLLSAEWYLDFPDTINPRILGRELNDILQVALIADGGYGVVRNYEEGEHDDWARFSGAGLLFKMSWNESFSSQVSVAWPTMSKSSVDGTGDDADDPAIYADLTFFFN